MTVKYFLNKNGVPTKRLAGKAGSGHIEIAMTTGVPLVPGNDIYDQMFAHGYVRVVEAGDAVHVDAPKGLSRKQKEFLEDKRFGGATVTLNNREVVEGRSTKAAQIACLMAG